MHLAAIPRTGGGITGSRLLAPTGVANQVLKVVKSSPALTQCTEVVALDNPLP